jgi:hypothetical protein
MGNVPFVWFIFCDDVCPAGRAHVAWGGHFVACIPVLVAINAIGPPVGRVLPLQLGEDQADAAYDVVRWGLMRGEG